MILLSPILAWAALAILVTQGRPILFRQERPGLGGRAFTMVKFRTMRELRPGEVYYLTDDERVLVNDPHQRERALWERLSAVG